MKLETVESISRRPCDVEIPTIVISLGVQLTETNAWAHIHWIRLCPICNRRNLKHSLVTHARPVFFQIDHVLGIHLRPEHRRELRRRSELLGTLVLCLLLAQYRLGLGFTHVYGSLLLFELLDAFLKMVEGCFELVNTRLEIRSLRHGGSCENRQGNSGYCGREFHARFTPIELESQVYRTRNSDVSTRAA